jgi:hypothetical protein
MYIQSSWFGRFGENVRVNSRFGMYTGEEVLSMFVILAGKCPFTGGDYKTEKRT